MRFKHVSFLLFFIIAIEIIFLGFLFLKQENSTQVNLRSTVRNTPTPTIKSLVVRAAIPYWDQENAVESFKKNADLINNISLFWYYLDSTGEIQKYEYAKEDRSIIDFAHENSVKVSAVITNLPEIGSWDSERVKRVLENEQTISDHVDNIKQLLIEKNFDGVTIDYESIDPSERDNFSKFVKRLSEVLHKDGKYIEVALHPIKDEKTERQYFFQDWKNLSENADRVYIMAYGQHSDEDDSGPIASIDWVFQILSYAKNQNIPQEKLFLGIPLYGYDWHKDSDEPAEGLTFQDVSNLLLEKGVVAEWDENSKSPHLSYGGDHKVWFENGRSVEEKIKLAKEFGLAGITFWRLGEEDPNVWNVIKEYRSQN